jgi:hypothetical protein
MEVHVACIRRMKNAYEILVAKPQGKYHWEEIILKWFLGKWIWRMWTEFI